MLPFMVNKDVYIYIIYSHTSRTVCIGDEERRLLMKMRQK